MHIYLSGSISNNENYLNDFIAAEQEIKAMFPQATIINPLTYGEVLKNSQKSSYADLLLLGMNMLSKCDGIFLLESWTQSNGAIAEYWYALALGLEVFYQNNQTKM